MWLKKYPDGGKVEKPKPKFNIKNDPLRPKGLGVQMQDNTRPIPVIDRIKVHKEIQNRVALAKINSQPQLKQAVTKNLYEQKLDLAKKEAYATSQPNAKLVNGQLEEINPGYKMEGQPFGPNEKRFEKGLSHLVGGVEATTYLTGVGELAGMAKPVLKQAAKYLTEQTALKNAYKLNPYAEKLANPNNSYRVAGRDSYNDFLNTGTVRSVAPSASLEELSAMTMPEKFKAIGRPTSFPSFQKGFADTRYLPKDGGVIYETSVPTFKRGEINPVTGETIRGRHYAHRPIDMKTGKTITELPASDVKVFEGKPNWLQGYKELPKTQTTSQEILSTSSGMDAIKSGYNSQMFVKQGYVPPTTDPNLMATQSGFTWALNPLSYFGERLPRQYYRKVGSGKGMQSIIDNKGIVSPSNDHLFFGAGNSPIESYSGTFAVGYKFPREASTKGVVKDWTSFSGPRGKHVGLSPTDISGNSLKNIPLSDENLSVYRRFPFTNAYTSVSKESIMNPKGFRDFLLTSPELATAQKYAEDAAKLGIYGSVGQVVGNSVYGTKDNPQPLGKPILPLLYQKSKEVDKKLGLSTFQQGGTINNWLNKY